MRQARLRRGLSQRALAELCRERGVECDDSNISKYERGKCMPYPPLRATLAEILDLDIDLQPKAEALR